MVASPFSERISSPRYVIEVERIYFAGVVCTDNAWGAALLFRERLTADKRIYPVKFLTGTNQILADLLNEWDEEYQGKEFAEHKHGLCCIATNKVAGFENVHPLKASFPKGIKIKSQNAHPVGLIQKWASDYKNASLNLDVCENRQILKAEINKGILSPGAMALLLANMLAPNVPQSFVSARANHV